MNKILVPDNVLTDMVGFVELSSMATKRAVDEVNTRRQAEKRAADLRPALLDHMIKTKVVQPNQKEAADAMLAGHDTTMKLLKAAVDKIDELNAKLAGGTQKQAGDLGQGVNGGDVGVAAGGSYQKVGEYNSLTHPIVGEKTANVKESDKALMKAAGIPVTE